MQHLTHQSCPKLLSSIETPLLLLEQGLCGLRAQTTQYPTHRSQLEINGFWLQDPELLSFIDIECYCWSTVLAEFTPMINAGMVFCDRHYGGINYPKVRRTA